MSLQESIRSSVARLEEGPDDFPFHIDLRLELDRITEFHAEHLRSNSRRSPTRKELVRLACRIYEARRARDRVFGRTRLGDMAWDMLLALYCLPTGGERLGPDAFTLATDVAQGSGNRWQAVLADEGLIERGPPETEARQQLFRLTEKGRKLLEGYLTRLFYCDAPRPLLS